MASTGSVVCVEDVRQWGLELDAVARRIGARFPRSETRDRVRAYLVGLLGPVQRKNAWQVAEQIGDAGKIAILSATANATNQNAWIELMKTELADNHPDIELVEVVYGDDDDQTSFDKTAALLQTYPDLKGIISPTTVGISAAARYLQTSEFKGKVALTGLGTPNQMRDYVNDGTVTSFALWNPGDVGYLASYAAKALIEGDITGAEGDEFDGGKLGSYTIGADGVVLLGDPFVFDKENIADFNF